MASALWLQSPLQWHLARTSAHRIEATLSDDRISNCLECVYNTRAMLRIRHLLAQRLTNPAVTSLLLLVVAFRLLLPPGLMLSPSTGVARGDLAICSGHGALVDDPSTISANPVAKAAVENLANAFAGSPQHADHVHASDLCPFSAALAIGVATSPLVLAHWLRLTASAVTARPTDDAFPSAAPTHGPLGARAPPLATLC
jgi:hypothetical protein